MVTATDLMGLGLSPFVAGKLSTTPTLISPAGTTQASATQIGPLQQLVYATAGSVNGGIKLPALGGASGCSLGDDYSFLNLMASTINVFTASSGTIYITGASTNGANGVGIDPGFQAIFQMVTGSTWMAVKASA